MKIDVKIERIIIDGYERLVYVDCSARHQKLWLHFIQHEEYLEAGEMSEFLSVGQNVTFDIGIELVNDYSVHNCLSSISNKFVQPINESSHVITAAIVMRIEDDYTLICNIEALGGDLSVVFEEKVGFKKGDILMIKGNLKAELC